jgi:hypothetical protein
MHYPVSWPHAGGCRLGLAVRSGVYLSGRMPAVARTSKAGNLAAAALLVSVMFAPGANAATTALTQIQTTPVPGGIYTVQNNEWGPGAAESIATNWNAQFTVANSAIDGATNGAPGGYPPIYQDCHWGTCTSGGLSATPIQVSSRTAGKVATSWSTTQPGGSNVTVAGAGLPGLVRHRLPHDDHAADLGQRP